jgi:hypothetical protein
MDLERIASVYPQIMTDILSKFDFKDVLIVRGVSTTLYQFLMKDRQVWIRIFTKIYSDMLVNNDDARFPLKLSASFETKEEMKRVLKQQWMDVFDKIKQIASIPSLMKMCQLFSQAPENYVKICSEINHLMSEGGYPEIPNGLDYNGPDDPTCFMWIYFFCTWSTLNERN